MTKKQKKELQRVKNFIRKAEKRGYIFNSEFKKSLNKKSTRALQNLTPRKLYEQATYDIGGVPVSGLRGRQIEREKAARKGVETKKRKEKDYDVPPKFNDLVYQNIIDLINTYPTSESAGYLRNLLNSEIRKYGLDAVIRGMNAVDEDLIKRAGEIIYYEGDSIRIHDALRSFSDSIRSGVELTKNEAFAINKVMEAQ